MASDGFRAAVWTLRDPELGDIAMPAGWEPVPTSAEIELAESLAALEREVLAALGSEDVPEGVMAGSDSYGEDWAGPSDAELVAAMCARPVDALDLSILTSIDPEQLPTPLLQLAYAQRIDQVAALAASRQLLATAALAGPQTSGSYLDEVHVETELALSRRISPVTAGLEIERARDLVTTFADYRVALAAGLVSPAHIARLVQGTRAVQDEEVRREIGRRAMASARRDTPGAFGRTVAKLVAQLDPDAAERMKRRARSEKDVEVRRLDDGLAQLVWTDTQARIEAAFAGVRRDGRAIQIARRVGADASPRTRRKAARKAAVAEARGGERDADIEAGLGSRECRADALAARLLGVEQDDGSVVLDPSTLAQIEVQVVIDLETLRGEADRMALLDGGPVPARVGRELACHARSYRRMITDPRTGVLIDHGTRRYRAADVHGFVMARDGGCRIPGCPVTRRDRMQVDHATPFPHGPTSSANLGALDTTHHQLKTAGYLRIAESAADGSAVLETLWGQRVVIPPRPFLHDPRTTGWTPSPTEPDEDDEPPF